MNMSLPRTWRCSLPAAICVAAILALPAVALAQNAPRIAVRIVDDVGFSSYELEELQQGIEEITAEFGDFDVVAAGDLERDLNRTDIRTLEQCGTDATCYADVLLPVGIDFVMVSTVFDLGETYGTDLTGLNLHGPETVSSNEGSFPDPADVLYLLVPVFEVLSPLADIDTTGGSASNRGNRDRDRDRDNDGNRAPWRPPTVEEPSDTNVLAVSLIVGGGALTVGGLVMWVLADDTQAAIQRAPHERAELIRLQDRGNLETTMGNVMLGVGVAALVTGIVFELVGVGAGGNDQDYDDDEWVRFGIGGSAEGPMIQMGMEF